jgi:hypothetical protein
MKKGTRTYVGPSQIHGNGLFAGEDLSVDDGFFGTTHEDNWPTTDLGQNYNHSDSPNARVTKIGNKHFIMPIDKIGAGEEITVDYRKQPDLEQPQEEWNYQNGGKIEPKITFTKDQLAEYESGYTGEVPFMDQIFNEYRDMNYFPVMNEDGSLSAYEVADISEGIMQHGYRGRKLAEITGADRARIDEMFQPVYDYHQAKYDERGMRKIQEYMDMGFTKEGAFNELIKSDFGTQEGLERIFGERAEGIASRKLAAERAARDLMERQKFEEEQRQYEEDPYGMQALEEYKKEQSRMMAENLKNYKPQPEQVSDEDLIPNYMQPEVSESTDVTSTNLDSNLLFDRADLTIKTPQQARAEQEAFVQSAMNEYYTNRVLWEDELGLSRDDFVNPETGDYDDVALVQAMYAPEMQQKKIQNFQAQEQKIWDDMPWYKKAGQQVVAFMDDPILTGSQWMQGEGAMVGQEAWLSDPEKAQQVADRYGITTQDLYDVSGDSESWINDAFKIFNPLHYATQSGVSLSDAASDFDKGEYAEGLKDLGYAGVNLIGGITGANELTGATKMLGYATANQLGVGQVLRGVAKPSELFKRKDLVRITGKESLQELKDRIASGQFDPSDAMWQQALKNNDELAKYASQYGDDLMIQTTPLTEAAASQYNLGNLMTRVDKGKSLPTGITREAVEDAATKSIPSRAEMMNNPAFREHYLSLPLNQRINVNQMVSQPQNYWQNSLLQIDNKIVNPGLKDALGRNMFNTGEYLLPRKLDEFTTIGSRSIDDISAGSLITPGVVQAEKVAAQQTATRAGSQAIAESRGEEVPVEEQPAEQQRVQSASINTDAVQSPGQRGLINYMNMRKMFGGAGF